MKSAVPAGQYRLDPYFAVLLTKIEGLGPAQLLHVLVVHKAGEADPVFFVTAEIERRPDEIGTLSPVSARSPRTAPTPTWTTLRSGPISTRSPPEPSRW